MRAPGNPDAHEDVDWTASRECGFETLFIISVD